MPGPPTRKGAPLVNHKHAPTRAEILELKTRLASINETAAYVGVNPKTIRRRISDGTLTGHRVGPRLIRIDLDEVDARLLRTIPTAG